MADRAYTNFDNRFHMYSSIDDTLAKVHEISEPPREVAVYPEDRAYYAGKKEVPIWEKTTLSIDEAAKLTHIGVGKIRTLTNSDDCPFVLWVGNKRLIKRKRFEEFLDKQFSI